MATAVVVSAALLLVGAPAANADEPADVVSGVSAATLPPLARQSLPLISDLTATACPELPPSWVVAQVQAESGWDTRAHSDLPGGAAGLYQMTQAAWVAAGGGPWASDPPADSAAVLLPESHLRVAIPWVCANLRAVTAHLTATGKPTAPLDAMLVCHVAGCNRVTESRTGIPAPGEAGCDDRCAQLVRRYLDAVHDNLRRFAATSGPHLPDAPAAPAPADAAPADAAGAVVPAIAAGPLPGIPAVLAAVGALAAEPLRAAAPYGPVAPLAVPAPAAPVPAAAAPVPAVGHAAPSAWRGGATGCRATDPTGGACLTGATRHGFDAVVATFGGFRAGPVVHSAGCYDRHAWNPTSDHSKGKACDFMMTRPGTFAHGTELDHGWEVARWLRANAGPLEVKYLIWQGRFWAPGVRDEPGAWGIRYTGGGIYNVRNATGGHFDHVHASFQE